MANQYSDMNIRALAILGVVSAILVVVSVVGAQALFLYESNREYDEKVISQVNQELVELKAEQQGRLAGKIDRAMDAVVAEFSAAGVDGR